MVKVDRTVRSEIRIENVFERAQETRLTVLNFIEELNEGTISLTRTWRTAFTQHKKVKPKTHERARSWNFFVSLLSTSNSLEKSFFFFSCCSCAVESREKVSSNGVWLFGLAVWGSSETVASFTFLTTSHRVRKEALIVFGVETRRASGQEVDEWQNYFDYWRFPSRTSHLQWFDQWRRNDSAKLETILFLKSDDGLTSKFDYLRKMNKTAQKMKRNFFA